MISSLLDDVMDRTVIAGYTNVGYRIRSRGWPPAELRSLRGKVTMVTGANAGLGFAAAEGFARLGASVWLVVRDRERGEQARARVIEQTGNEEVHVAVCDLSDLGSVTRFAADFNASAERLDVLVNNAGVLTQARELSVDGIELTFATNVLGPFLLTSALLPLLELSAPARVINVSSAGMYTQRIRVEDLQSERGEFNGPTVYARTKRAQVILTELWSERLAQSGVSVHAMHPGWADTPGLQSSLPLFHRLASPLLRTAEQGADTIVWLGAAEEPGHSSGRFWHDRRPRPTHLMPRTRETPQERQRLWEQCCRLSGREERPDLNPHEENPNGKVSSNT